MSSFKKTVFVTGASSDIGLAVCHRYLADGQYRLITHYRTPRPELEALITENSEGRIIPFQLDFSDTVELENFLVEKADLVGSADILINLAAELSPTSFETISAQEILDVLSINLIPGLLLMQAMGPTMAKRGWGRIVHASSIGVKFGGGQNSFAYSLSKHAIEFLPASCRDWAKDGVLTNIARIGVTDTQIHNNIPGKNLSDRVSKIPMGRMATSDEIAEFLFWLGSEKNSYISNQIIPISGGE